MFWEVLFLDIGIYLGVGRGFLEFVRSERYVVMWIERSGLRVFVRF